MMSGSLGSLFFPRRRFAVTDSEPRKSGVKLVLAATMRLSRRLSCVQRGFSAPSLG